MTRKNAIKDLARRLQMLTTNAPAPFLTCLTAVRQNPELVASLVADTEADGCPQPRWEQVRVQDLMLPDDAEVDDFDPTTASVPRLPAGPLMLLACPWPGCDTVSVWDHAELAERDVSSAYDGCVDAATDGFCDDDTPLEERRRPLRIPLDEWATMDDEVRDEVEGDADAARTGTALLRLHSGDYSSMAEYDKLLGDI